ncbi:SpoIIE family protein phosphatase [Streptomyces sp. NPDC048419]|uniref:SpoIIE family protein phosphatase n=1 Tax=Streptomyces sp. NPDC048419 TaxID=3365547 RepID=UPI00370F86F9
MRRLHALLNPRTVAGQVFLLQLALVLLLVAVAVTALVQQDRRQATADARDRSLAVAEAFANSPGIVEAMTSPDPTAVLQPRTEKARKRSGVDYIVVLSPYGFRWTHPDPRLIGKHVSSSYQQALNGEPYQTTFDSSLGRAVDSTVAVFNDKGSVVGLVTVGVTVKRVSSTVNHQMPVLFGSAGAALLLAAGGSALVSGRLRRQTHGLGAAEMTRMYEHHDAVLHAVREGILIVDRDGRLLLANDEARWLLDLPPDVERRRVSDIALSPTMAALLVSGRTASDEVHAAGNRLLAVNLRPVSLQGGTQGSVATLRDTTELRALADRADLARGRLQLLYQASVRIGTTLDITRTAQELSEVAVPQFADFVTVELLEPVLNGGEPDAASTEMRRIAAAGVHDDPPLYPVGRLIRFVADNPVASTVASGQGVLVPDLAASGGWRSQDLERSQKVLDYGIHSLLSVPLQARGVVLGMAEFWRAEQGAFDPDDLASAEELAARAAVCIDNARRYTREHTTAVALQRSLLPGKLPEQSALDVGHRYLPAQAGVGGDWFDVIPLPGARVGLVVGDVVGHGLHAAATMGRLRTAVHNFSALDLPPDEIVQLLDDLVARADQDAATDGTSTAMTGATCLYAIYDPISGTCQIATAGHPGPALVSTNATVTFPDIPVSPPLGVGGAIPVETAELHLPEGTRLVLYTDGLVEDRHHDLDTRLDLLRQTLTATSPHNTPQDTCQAVIDAMLPTRPADDVALLIAHTHRLNPQQVKDWDIPSDPAAVPNIRAEVTHTLETWGLEDISFATELIVSELVTNAIRYGCAPVRLRLLRDQEALICEVTDASSTAPHLRRATLTDEGGRGLYLVAQFSRRWGTRYMDRGKTIWTEQAIGEKDDAAVASADALLDLWDDTEL